MSVSDLSNPGADRRFVKAAMARPLLEADQEAKLARDWRENEDEAALHDLTMAYMRLVISIAGKFRHYGLPISDLIQEGNIGLMQAAARFEPSREVRFSTYATWWIRASIQDYVLRNWSIVRTGTTAAQKSLFFNLKRIRAQIDDLNDETLSAESTAFIATELGVKEAEVEKMAARMSASDRSLNLPIGEDGGSQYQDLIPDDAETPEEAYTRVHDGEQRSQWVREAMSRLTEREQVIIRRRRLTENTETLEALGQELGISKERVRQIEQAALNKLRSVLGEIVGDPEAAGILPEA